MKEETPINKFSIVKVVAIFVLAIHCFILSNSFGEQEITPASAKPQMLSVETVSLEGTYLHPVFYGPPPIYYDAVEDNESNTTSTTTEDNLLVVTTKSNIPEGIIFDGDDVVWSSVKEGSDLYWLAKLIHGESEGEPYDGKVAVGNVVMNRVKDQVFFDNTVKDVIFQKNQFAVVGGRLNLSPNQESINAAYDVLYNGAVAFDMPEKVLYFNTSGKWWNGITIWKKIGHHYFGIQNY